MFGEITGDSMVHMVTVLIIIVAILMLNKG